MARVLSFDMGTRNLAYALVEEPRTVLRMGMIDLGKHAARQATDTLVDTLTSDNEWMLEEGHDVVVELQPGSGICKTLSHVLQTIFLLSDKCRGYSARPFRFMQAGNKLRYDQELFDRLRPTTYGERKRCAVAMAERIFQYNHPRYLEFFRSMPYKQRTDLADAVVQGCRYFQ